MILEEMWACISKLETVPHTSETGQLATLSVIAGY